MENKQFSRSDKMTALVNADFTLLLTISRFDIPMGFGDKTIAEVCDTHNVDCNTFLAVVNFLSETTHDRAKTYEDIDLKSVTRYLKNAHKYFLEYKLPALRTKLLLMIDSQVETAVFRDVFLKFFDEYFTEVKKHMDYENKTVFPYINNIMEGKRDKKYHIGIFEQRHDRIEQKLKELKNILMKHYSLHAGNNLLTELLLDIFLCEKDLTLHCAVEDSLIIPAMMFREAKIDTQ
ncbi:MAG: hemerythrin domain-containing protein [Prevotellaceae bacterium]|jgi:regulator of cell morphogenesis and NO signaling|nr:hemerythrin domain-containing protein [Prevotellaceae bacterium]